MPYFENFNLEDVVTPVNFEKLNELLERSNYDEHKRDFLVRGFKEGFHLNYEGPVHRRDISHNIPFTVGDKKEMWKKIMKEVSLGHFAGPFDSIPFEHYIQSPIGLVPKAGGQTRLIFHLSYEFPDNPSVNACTPAEKCTVKYRDLDYTVKKILELIKLVSDRKIVIWFGKSDLKLAFRILGTHPMVWWTMVMSAENPLTGNKCFFIDKCLPFGHSMSCVLFQEFSDALDHILRFLARDQISAGGRTTNYLDDFLFIAIAKLLCNLLLKEFLNLCKILNVPLSDDKTEWASSLIVFLGVLLDRANHLLAIPEEKRLQTLHKLQNLISKKKAPVQDLQSLVGLLNFINRAIVPGRAFTRCMYSKFSGKFVNNGNKLKKYHHVRLDGEFKNDCRVWKHFLNNCSRSICRPFIDLNATFMADTLKFMTDAAKGENLGFGGIFNKHWIVGQWESGFIKEADPGIEILELYRVTIAVFAWAWELRNKRIILFCDNQSVVTMINNTTSSCKYCMALIRKLTLKSLEFNFRVFAQWVRVAFNLETDLLSRQKFSKFKEIAPDMDPHPAKLHSDHYPSFGKLYNGSS